MYEIYLLFNVDKELNDEVKELLLKNPINDNCSYFVCKYSTLETIKVVDTDCKKWCRPLCQNEYNSSKHSNVVEPVHGVKKRCKPCVDRMINKFDNSINDHNTESHLLLKNNTNDNQLDNIIVICDEWEQENVNNNENNDDQESFNEEDMNEYNVDKDYSKEIVLIMII